MGLISKLFGIEIDSDNNGKTNEMQGYLSHVSQNFEIIEKKILELRLEIQTQIKEIKAESNKKNGIFGLKKNNNKKYECQKKLSNLYLANDFLNCLVQHHNGISLSDDKKVLVIKFAPFFDGVDVLQVEDNEWTTLLTRITATKVGRFKFEKYLERNHRDNILDLKLPDIDSTISSFKAIMSAIEVEPLKTESVDNDSNLVECVNCKSKISEGIKFCPKCGTKVKVNEVRFCTECGKELEDGDVFCSNCGQEVKEL